MSGIFGKMLADAEASESRLIDALESLLDYAKDCAADRDERPLCIKAAELALADAKEKL